MTAILKQLPRCAVCIGSAMRGPLTMFEAKTAPNPPNVVICGHCRLFSALDSFLQTTKTTCLTACLQIITLGAQVSMIRRHGDRKEET